MVRMRKQYELAVDADQINRTAAVDDLRFVTVPGHQWDANQRKRREVSNRACYEFPILRSHWRQVVNDQKQARPSIKVRAVEDGDVKGAELRQGLIKNIEAVSRAERAYDSAHEMITAAGYGAFRITTDFSTTDGWDQDICIRPIADPLNSVWFDPGCKEMDGRDATFVFVEETLTRAAFREKYPDADAVDFEASQSFSYNTNNWFGEDSVRVAEWWRTEPVEKTICLLSDGRSVDAEQFAQVEQEEAAKGVTCVRQRKVKSTKVVMSIVSGKEEIDGPHDWPGSRIPIVRGLANWYFIDGRWVWCGMVRFSRDPQKLVNYNFTTAQEVISKQPKAPYLVTPKMLEGAGVKAQWDQANSTDLAYLSYTPDPMMPSGPIRLPPPQIASAFMEMGQMGIDMLKASDGIYDESQGKQTNATSGKAILARQREGDVASFDYSDVVNIMIQSAGEIVLELLPKVYDTPRAVRVLGKDGAEDWVKLYDQEQDKQTGQMVTVNDLSAGKYDVTVVSGPSYPTMRSEFAETFLQLAQQDPAIMQIAGDLLFKSMDFPGAEEVSERLKMMLPPPILQQLQSGKDQPPEVAQMQAQMQQMQQGAQQRMAEMQQEMAQLQAKANSKDDAALKLHVSAMQLNIENEQKKIDWYNAVTARLAVFQKNAAAAASVDMQAAQEVASQISAEQDRQVQVHQQAADHAHQVGMTLLDQQHQAAMAQQAQEAAQQQQDSQDSPQGA